VEAVPTVGNNIYKSFAVTALVILVFLVVGCGGLTLSSPHTAKSTTLLPHRAAGGAVVFSLLENNRLIALSASTGALLRQIPLGPLPNGEFAWWRSTDSHYLALSMNWRTLFVIVPGFVPGRPHDVDHLAVITVATGRVRALYRLPAGIVFTNVGVVTNPRRLYLFGARPTRPRAGFTYSPLDALVTVLDPRTGAIVKQWVAQKAHGQQWFVYRGLVSPNGRRLYLSYHGPGPTGLE